MDKKYTLDFSKNDIVIILRGLNREVEAQRDMMTSFETVGYRSGALYCNRLKQWADKITQRLLSLPDMEDDYSDARKYDIGMEPSFIKAVMETCGEWPAKVKDIHPHKITDYIQNKWEEQEDDQLD